MTLGQRIVAAREKLGMTRGDVARAAGIGRATLVQIEGDVQEQKNLRLVTVMGLIDALAPEIGLRDFLDGVPFNRVESITVKLRRVR